MTEPANPATRIDPPASGPSAIEPSLSTAAPSGAAPSGAVNSSEPHDAPLPDLKTAEAMLTAAIGQIQWARQYTLTLLRATPKELWFERPQVTPITAGPITAGRGEPVALSTHVAWQVGHLAVSQYGLLMFRIHGRRDDDLDLIPSRFRKAFSRGSDPAAEVASQCSADELVERLERVHQAAIDGLTNDLDPNILLQSVEMPYAVYPIKLGAILFCPLHEHIHSGQIGLIRRCLGLAPVR